MGKIKSQGISNTIWTYIGIIAGGLYSIFIIPKAFASHPEYWGLIQFLVYYMQVFLPLAQLGMPNTIIRFFSKTEEEEIPSFYGFTLIITLLMTTLVSLLYFNIGPVLANSENKDLFTGNYLWLIPMLVGSSFFETFSSIAKAQLKSKVPVFLKESLPKLWTLVIITTYWLEPFSFELFLLLYSSIYIFQFIVMLIYLLSDRSFTPKLDLGYFKIAKTRHLYPYMIISLFVTSTTLWSVKIDILMIGYLADLKQVAYYSIALYMATLIIIPFRSVSSIASPMVAGFWTNNQHSEIGTVLKKVSEVSLAAGSFIFLALWLNIEWILSILGTQFGDIKWVFMIIGISRLVDAAFSINGSVILTSKYYKVDFFFQLVLVALSIGLNLWLIPIFNLEGAAIATLAALLIYNMMKWTFLIKKFKFSTFTSSTATSILLLLGFIILAYYNPLKDSFWMNAFVSTGILSVVYFVAIYRGNLSLELRETLTKVIKRD